MEVQPFTSPMVGWFLRETNCYNKKCLIKSYWKSSFDVSRTGRNLVRYKVFHEQSKLAYLDAEFVQRATSPNILIHGEPRRKWPFVGNSK